MLEICADSWIFLSVVLFGSSMIIVSFSFFFSLNPDVLSGSLWQCLGSFCLRFVQRVKLLSERSGPLQKVSEVPVLQHSPSPHSPLRVWSAGVTGSFLARCRCHCGAPGLDTPSCPGPAPAALCRAGPDSSEAAPRGTASPALLRLPLCASHMPERRWESEAQRAPLGFGGFSITLPLLANSDLRLGKKLNTTIVFAVFIKIKNRCPVLLSAMPVRYADVISTLHLVAAGSCWDALEAGYW